MRVIIEDDMGILHERVSSNEVCVHCSLVATCKKRKGMLCVFSNEIGGSHNYKKLKGKLMLQNEKED